MSDVVSGISTGHPAPHRHRVRVWLLLGALAAAPLGWLLALVVNYGLASHACFPGDAARLTLLPSWGWVWPAMLGVFIAALIAAALGALISVRNWRNSRSETGSRNGLLEGGEGRTRFLAAWGIMAGGGFIVAGGFNLIAIFGMPLCGFH